MRLRYTLAALVALASILDYVADRSAQGAEEGRSRMKKESITRFKLSPKKPPKTDWRAFDAMSEEQRHRAAVSDSDAPPATESQLARARRVPTVRALRES